MNMTSQCADPSIVRSSSSHLQQLSHLSRAALWVTLACLVPAVLWLAFAPLGSAVVAPAYVKVDLNRRPVQHAEGGVVREVLVRDGQRVARGQALIVLGDVAVQADASRLDYRAAAEHIGIARLEAEEAMREDIQVPTKLSNAARTDPRVQELLDKERALFRTRRSALLSQIALLRAQQEGVKAERTAMKAQIANAGESLQRQRAELENLRPLQAGGFISGARVSQMEAALADYGVKLEERRAEAARADQRAAELDLRIRTLENDYRQQASDQLRVAAARLVDLEQEQRKSHDAAHRQIITAPADGEVMNLRITAPGAVIGPRDTVADIMPATPRLLVEAAVRTSDIGEVWSQGKAKVRFPAFKSAITPLVDGRVVYVSPDRIVDPSSRAASYSVQIELDAQSLAAAGHPKIQPGMPAEVYIEGQERTPLVFLFEPVADALRRSARER
jgi:membrane fusion protein, epimerase transport system